jgi:hypothetical protein
MVFKRRFKRKFKFKRRRTYSRRRPTIRRRESKPEVKYLTVPVFDIPVSLWKNGSPTTLLGQISGSGNKIIRDLFDRIEVGTLPSQRIGRTIFVKSIRSKFSFRFCPTQAARDNGYTKSPANPISVRMIWFDSTSTIASDTELFQMQGLTQNFDVAHKYVDRTQFMIFADKMFTARTGGFSVDVGTSVSGANFSVPPSLTIAHTLPVNKTITYRNVDQQPKSELETYTLAFIASDPSCQQTFLAPQYLCCQGTVRVYYTDV